QEGVERFERLELHIRFHSGGSDPAPANFLNSSMVSASRGNSRMARSFSSGINGVGSSPTTLRYSLTNSGSLQLLRIASLIILARSFCVTGGIMNGDPESRKRRNIDNSLRPRSVLAKVSISGRREKSRCFSPLGISMTTWKSTIFFSIHSGLRE